MTRHSPSPSPSSPAHPSHGGRHAPHVGMPRGHPAHGSGSSGSEGKRRISSNHGTHARDRDRDRDRDRSHDHDHDRNQGQGRSAKRPKIFRACASCVTSKTRCEDVTADGCALCRRRGRVCSLAAIASAMEANGAAEVLGLGGGAAGPGDRRDGTSDPRESPCLRDLRDQLDTRYPLSPRDPRDLRDPLGPRDSHRAISAPSSSHAGARPASLSRDWHHPSPTQRPTSASAPGPGPSSPSATIEDLQRRLAEAERRVARTELAMMDLEEELHRDRQGRGRRRSVDGDLDRDRERERERERERDRERGRELEPEPVQLAGPLRFATLLLYRLDEAMFSVGSTRLYPDPVARGIVPASHVELAWHGFKARIAGVLPLPPFLAVSTPPPAHGFVVLAALAHVPSAYSAALDPLLNECILLAMSSAASVDVMLALLILSLAPLPPDDTTATGSEQHGAPCTPSAYRLISLSYQMGQSLGFEGLAEAALAKGQDLNIEWYGEQLWSLQLWTAIVNRFAVLSLLNGQIARLPPRLAHRLPTLLRDSVEMCNRHLKAEAAVVDIFEPVAQTLCALEHVDEYVLDEVRALHTQWKRATEEAKEFICADNQPLGLQRDALCIQFALGVRIASLTTWIPSPLRDAREAALPCLACFPGVMSQVLDMVAGKDAEPSTYPSYTIMFASAALVCLRRTVQFVRIAYGNTQMIDVGRLDAAQDRLVALSRASRFFITEANRLLDEMPYPKTWSGAAAPAVHGNQHQHPHAQSPNPVHGHDVDHGPGQGHGHDPHAQTNGAAAGPASAGLNFPLEFDIMNWDFSFLYPDIAAFQGMSMMEQAQDSHGTQH